MERSIERHKRQVMVIKSILGNRGNVLVVMALFSFLVLLSGCGPAKDYARVTMNWQVDQEFKSGKLQPEYRYYFNGPSGEPTALLALRKEYQLKSEFWHEFKVGGQLKSWVENFPGKFCEVDDIEYIQIKYRGMEITGKNGERIGMLYTKYYYVVAWWGEGNQIIVTQPEPSGGQRGIWSLRRKWSYD